MLGLSGRWVLRESLISSRPDALDALGQVPAKGDGKAERLKSTQPKLMTLGTILLVILILVLVGALPTWGYSRGWGYAPSGVLGLILIILLILVLMGRL